MTVPAQRSAAISTIGAQARICCLCRPEIEMKLQHGQHSKSDATVSGRSAWRDRIRDVAELVDVLTARVARLDAAGDHRAPFCRAYAMHASCLRRAAAAGAFGTAAAWVERLEIEAATRYLRALDAWDRGDMFATPAPWRAAFAMSRYGDTSPADCVRLGVYALICYELPRAIARIGLDEGERAAAEAAFARVSALLAANVGAMGEALAMYVPRSAVLGRGSAGSPAVAAEWLGLFRHRAWLDGFALLDAVDADARATASARIEREALRAELQTRVTAAALGRAHGEGARWRFARR